jgi:hypothetical protein
MAELWRAFLQIFAVTEAKKKLHEKEVHQLAHEICYSFIKKTAFEDSVTMATLLQTRQDIFKDPPTFTTQHKG